MPTSSSSPVTTSALLPCVAGYQYSPWAPSPLEVLKAPGKMFGLPKNKVIEVAENLAGALAQWPQFAEAAGADEGEAERVGKVFNP